MSVNLLGFENVGIFTGVCGLDGSDQPEDSGAARQCQLCVLQVGGQALGELHIECRSCIFNDVITGTIEMPCATNSPNCTTKTAGDAYGVLTGYNAGAGYDLATGLGSVNATNLVNEWSSVSSLPSVTTLNSLTLVDDHTRAGEFQRVGEAANRNGDGQERFL